MKYNLDERVKYRGHEAMVWDFNHRAKTYTLKVFFMENQIDPTSPQYDGGYKVYDVAEGEINAAPAADPIEWKFDYLGEDEETGVRYFCIISDDGKGNGQGLSVCYSYYAMTKDRFYKKLSYMDVPQFKNPPSVGASMLVMDEALRHFSGFIPLVMTIKNRTLSPAEENASRAKEYFDRVNARMNEQRIKKAKGEKE